MKADWDISSIRIEALGGLGPGRSFPDQSGALDSAKEASPKFVESFMISALDCWLADVS